MLAIVGGGGYNKSDPCQGVSYAGGELVDPFDYTDIHEGAQVRILDSSGEIIGTGTLGPGDYVKKLAGWGGDACVFELQVPLDRASAHYQFVLGERPPYDFDDPEGLELVVGGD